MKKINKASIISYLLVALLSITSVLFIHFKNTGVINWSWWLFPPVVIFIGLVLMFIVLIGIFAWLESQNKIQRELNGFDEVEEIIETNFTDDINKFHK